MKFARRRFLQLSASAAALPVVSGIAWAQAYPTRPVHLIVGFPAGTGPDIVARLIGEWLSRRLGRQFVVENRPGAASNIAAEAVVKAPPDGYTLLHVTVANAINARLSNGVNFSRDIAPIAGIARASFVMVVDPSFAAKTVPELVAYAKENPGKINMGSGGIGSAPYMAGELFKMMSGIDVVHVPYPGTPQAIADLLAGRVQLVFADPSSIEFIKAGKLRALAVTAATRQDALPDIPPVGDFIPGYEASTWHGVGAPKNVPPDIVNTLNREINAGLADPRMKARLANVGFTVTGGSPADFGRLIADEAEKWRGVTGAANIKPN